MKKISIPWGAWHLDTKLNLTLPEQWDVRVCSVSSSESVTKDEIENSIKNPLGIEKPLSSLVQGSKKIVISVEDITRPSYLGDILELLIDEITKANTDADITILICNGAHRPLTRADMIKKLGEKIVENYLIINHNPYDNLIETSTLMGKTPARLNRFFMEADFRIIVGSVLPHAFAGFSGGAKLVIPGLADINVLARSHKFVLMGFRGGYGKVEDNKFRTEIEEIVNSVGINFFVGYIPGADRSIAKIFAGDMITAHREAVQFAKSHFATRLPSDIDVIILNAYPKDTELLQADACLSILKESITRLKPEASVVITSACSEGVGYHALFGYGMRLYRKPAVKKFLSNKKVFFYSPNINRREFYTYYPEEYLFFNDWSELVALLSQSHKEKAKVAVLPTAPIQLPLNND